MHLFMNINPGEVWHLVARDPRIAACRMNRRPASKIICRAVHLEAITRPQVGAELADNSIHI
jgi:hypothetical protein